MWANGVLDHIHVPMPVYVFMLYSTIEEYYQSPPSLGSCGLYLVPFIFLYLNHLEEIQ